MKKQLANLRIVDSDLPIFETYGKLKEGLHIAGYTFERAMSSLEWMLKDDRWQLLGRFLEINKFLDSLRFDELRTTAEQRARLAKLIKGLQPKASNRQIARTIGVGSRTIDRDVAPNGAADSKKTNQNNVGGKPIAPNDAAPPRELSGAQGAKLVIHRATAKEDRLARVAADEQRVLSLRPVAGKFKTLVIDPAWEYDWLSIAGRAKPGYAMQSHEQLRELDIRQWADPGGCHLYVWTTNNFMARACELVAHWGFQHRVLLTWIKPPPFGLGSYFRNSTEHVLFATLGDTTTRHAAASIPTHFEAPRGEHSEKPEAFYGIVRAASYPPFGEGNQREARADFVNLFESSENATAAE